MKATQDFVAPLIGSLTETKQLKPPENQWLKDDIFLWGLCNDVLLKYVYQCSNVFSRHVIALIIMVIIQKQYIQSMMATIFPEKIRRDKTNAPLKSNRVPLKNYDWKTILSFWDPACFAGADC